MFAKATGLSEAEYWALVMINEGCSTQTEICEQLSMNRQTIHSACKQLAKKGLVELAAKEENLRTKQITLTEAGRLFIERQIDGILRAEERAWEAFSKEEQAALVSLSFQYNRQLEKAFREHMKTKSF